MGGANGSEVLVLDSNRITRGTYKSPSEFMTKLNLSGVKNGHYCSPEMCIKLSGGL